MKQFAACAFLLLLLANFGHGQRAEVTLSFNEPFFDALLDAIYQNSAPPEFAIGMAGNSATRSSGDLSLASSFAPTSPACNESIKLVRESAGVRTAVRFREGKIYTPIAFVGTYSPPLVGCVEFSGFAETNINLEFDRKNQRLIGRAVVLNVSLNGTGGLGSNILARMVQSSIDKKVNPIEIVRMDKLSFVVPLQNSSSLRMRAAGVRHEVVNGALNVHIAYEFGK